MAHISKQAVLRSVEVRRAMFVYADPAVRKTGTQARQDVAQAFNSCCVFATELSRAWRLSA